MQRIWNAIVSAGLLLATATAAGQDPSRAGLDLFESRVRPLLVDRCYKCHGPDKQEGELRLDSAAAIQRGGASGAAVVSGKPDDSLLLAAVGYRNEELRMPPDKPLSPSEVAILKEWVARGMPHPDAVGTPPVPQASIDIDGRRQYWAFQTPVAQPLPSVTNPVWCQTPLDRFVLAELEAQGILPAGPADPLTWLRRVSLDLTGLPPSSQEVEDFLADHSPAARTRVVDRLLASPRYGERWGRHWLDIVRYADSNGLDENVAHGNAWRYRDYVIRAFNRDLPFDQFTREQLAGDLLPFASEHDRYEQLTATGFLALGAKVLAEVDEVKMEMDIVDEQVDTFGRAFLALTLGCARCHDHKFDPIRTDDYYALAGIFQSTRTMEHFKKVARWHENSIATAAERAAQEAHDRKLASLKHTIQQTMDAANAALIGTSLPPDPAPKDPAPKDPAPKDPALPKDVEQQYSDATKAQLKQLREEQQQLEKNPPSVSTAMGATEGTPADSAICLRGSHLTRGRSIPRGVPAVLVSQPLSIPAADSGRRELADWLTRGDHPLLDRVLVNRVWRWHFGRGIVESADNFGALGARPSHPELLDWSAAWFSRQGRSLKSLHRLIVMSAAYGQSSVTGREHELAARHIDPENRLLWRFPARRLEVEAVRDSLLMVGGLLDLNAGGSLLHVGNREYLFDHTSKDLTKYDSHRRTVYLPVIRNNLYDMSQLFDATDATVPSGDRAISTVATQALFMMNSSLVLDSAASLAERACSQTADDRARFDWLAWRCFGRSARDDEVERGRAFLAQFAHSSALDGRDSETLRRDTWQLYCQALLASNEFITLR